MASLAPVFKKAYLSLVAGLAIYGLTLVLLTIPYLQRHVLYAHTLNTVCWHDINNPEQFGFAKNQVTPFNITTPDGESLHAWHVMPLGLYAKHESDILAQPSGFAEDISKTKAFELLRDDPDARLIVTFHGNAGHIGQGWRTDSYRAYSDVSTSNIHILAIDYRGFGLSTGFPTEEGLITDGIATVNWAINVAKVPSDRIVILGQSLGTAVTSAVAEHFAKIGTDFAGVILIAGFTDLPNLLTTYSIGGWVPILSPLRQTPVLQKIFTSFVVDKWPSAERLATFIKVSKKARLFFIHAIDDYEIPCAHSDALFLATANATMNGGMDEGSLLKLKARSTVHNAEGAFISTWKVTEHKMIREEIVAYGGHNRIMTFSPVSLAVWKAFGLDNGGSIPVV